MSKIVVVLGMHRSGTSMVGGILEKLGVSMGELEKNGNINNPFGYFEDKNFLELNRQILSKAGGSWSDVPSERSILAQKDKFKMEIENLFNNKPNLWGWKDPRTILTIELYLPYLHNPYFIVCYRNPKSVAKSLYRRERMSFNKSIELCNIYNDRIENFFKKFPNLKRLNIQYEKITSDPKKYLTKIIYFLNINFSDRQYQDALDFILPLKKKEKIRKKLLIKDAIITNLRSPWRIPLLIINIIRSEKRIKLL